MRFEQISQELDFFVWLIRYELDDYQYDVNKQYIQILSISPFQLMYKTKSFQFEYQLDQLDNSIHHFTTKYL